MSVSEQSGAGARRVAAVMSLLTVSSALGLAGGSPAAAQDSPDDSGSTSAPSAGGGQAPLEVYLNALSERRLLAAETGSVERLRELVHEGEELFLAGRADDAALDLFEVAESPRFADFIELPEFRGAEFMLARSLEQLGALRTSARYLERILGRGPEDLYFGPAFRKMVDIGLNGGNPAETIAVLEGMDGLLDDLSEDAENELRYLRGRERYDAREWAAAEEHFKDITRRSRWYASSQYLRGAIQVRLGDLQKAEEHFCTIAEQGDSDRFTFFVDERYFEVKDLARLALGRVAHEGNRADDAFYYYFQVPADSERVSEALFEASYAMYEGGDMETAVDLLDQLETRYPESAFIDEATLLRGYVHLARCEFEQANRLFQRFATRFGPIVSEIDEILENPPRQSRLYEELLADEQRALEARSANETPGQGEGEGDAQGAEEVSTRVLLLAMLRIDPAFYRLHADVRTLDAEAARAGRLSSNVSELLARVRGQDRPAAAAELDEGWDDNAEVTGQIEDARAVLQSLNEQLDAMRAARAPTDQLRPLREETRNLGRRLAALERAYREAVATSAPAGDDGSAPAGADFEGLLSSDIRYANRLPARVATIRGHMVDAANESALAGLRALRGRIGSELRRARIGRIDAVMGSKRRIEIQIESLAAGRFPPELMDPLRVQGLLRDDEEYWPFEGELWEDEFDEADPIDDLIEDEEE